MIGERINHFGLSSGKDSTALWAWALNESGYPKETIRGSFCDTENEYQEVYDQIKALSDYGVARGVEPIVTLRSEGFLQLAIRKKRFPGARSRFCTEVLKMIPTRYHIQYFQLMGYDVVCHSGVRASESTERSLLEEWGEDPILGTKVRRPLLKKTLKEIWEYHRKYGLPINPLYFTGRKRVGCRLCCMSNKQDVRITAKTRPWVIDLYRHWETLVGSDRNGGFSSFFPATATPDHIHSRKYTRKDGEQFTCATIDDVVKWSMTLRGGKQQALDFIWEMEDEPIYELDDAHHPCKSGYCE